VVVAARDESSLQELAAIINGKGGHAKVLALDMSNAVSIAAAYGALVQLNPSLDILINNAGINLGYADTIISASDADVEQSIAVNAMGPLRLTKALLPLLRASNAARIVNVSSAAGSIAETVNTKSEYGFMEAGSYRLSKSMLNAITGLLAKALRNDGIEVNAMCPGWTRTDMGGADAPRTPEQAAEIALKLATLDANGSTGGFFNAAGAVPW
jgi:NAD(P)-dependent dehydrogenase (short-subunit alcohol dehydrogenase family)